MRRRLALAAASVWLWTAPASADLCRYTVTPDASAGLAALALDVRIACDAAVDAATFDFNYGGAAFADWAEGGALAYRIRLGDLARARRPSDFAATSAGVLAPIDAWLAAPAPAAADRLEIVFRPAPGVMPETNLARRGDVQRLSREDWVFGGYAVFARRPPLRASAPGPAAFDPPGRPGPATSDIRIAVLDDDFLMADAEFVAWIERFAGLVARYWAGFPSDRLLIAVASGGRPGDPFGRVRGGGGATMLLRLATTETPAFLNERDWVLTHELIHLGAPFARSRTPWLLEGMATYLEPVIRALGGARTRAQVWDEWLRMMPRGAQDIGRFGLEGGGHPYWTGALVFLLAQVELAAAGRPDALAQCFRRIRRDLGDSATRATIDDIVRACDRGAGIPALPRLRERHAKPSEIDLRELWRRLGVRAGEVGVRFDEAGRSIRRDLFDPAQLPTVSP